MSLFGPVSTLLLTLVSFVFIMTVVVFFHELGHFLVGRWCGVKVDAFSIGFGPEIYGRETSRGTRWRVAAVPLGGAGDLPGVRHPQADQPGEKQSDQGRGASVVHRDARRNRRGRVRVGGRINPGGRSRWSAPAR